MTKKLSGIWIQVFKIAILLTGINVYAQPEIPVHSSPADNAVQQLTRPVICWNSSPGAEKYILQVSGDSLFGTSSLVYNDTSVIDTSRQVGPLANNRTYYWRVSAKNGDGSSAFSGKWRFTTVQAPAVQATTIISSFTSPGSLPRGLAWDGDYLWMIDDVKNIYKCDTSGNIKKTIAFGDNFDRDISWDGTGLWIGGAASDGGALKIDANGNRIDSLPVHYSDSSGIEWDGQYFWFGDYGSSYIRMHKKDGSLFRNWPTSGITGHPAGISYDGIRLWIAGSGGESSNYIYKYSVLGQLIYSFDLNNIGIETAPSSFISLAWDGKSLWYASDKSFYIYRLSVPYYHSAPSAPVLTSPASGADEQDLILTLRWNSSLDATIYHLQVSTDPAFSNVVFNDSTITDTWAQVGPLEYYTTYYWHVRAKNSGGTSAWSGAFSFTTFNDPPSDPSNLKVIPGDNQVTLRWTPNPEPDLYKYKIYRDGSSPATTLIDSVFGLLPDTFYTDNGVTNGELYYYRITALDSAGKVSQYSDEVITMPQALTTREYQYDENTLLLFHMNESGGSTVYDFSGNSNNGSATGTTIVDGKYGKARSFIPPSDALSVVHDSSLNFGTGSYTLEFWVNASPSTTGGHILHKRGNTTQGTTGRGWYTIFGSDGTIGMTVYNDPNLDDNEGHSGVGSNRIITDGLWHHVAFVNTYDTIFCYIDGELDNCKAVSTPGSPDNDGILDIGVPSGGDGQFIGFVDEIRISGKARTTDEFNIFRPPQNPVMIPGDQQVTLSWDPVTETGVSKYYIYRDTVSPSAVLYDSVVGAPPDTFYVDTDLVFGKMYYYRISVVDNDGNESVVSKELELTYNIVIIDGIKDPFWETATAHIHLGQGELVEGEMDNEDDFSADLYLAYDSIYLYCFLEVKDDSVSSKSYDNWRENDDFLLKLDPVPDSVIPVNWGSWEEPDFLDIVDIEGTALTGPGESRNGNEHTIIKRALSDVGYVVEFAISAPGLFNYRIDPPETVLLQEGTQLGFFFEIADQDEESYREAVLAWGHSSANINSEINVTQFGSMTFLAGNQIQLSHDNLVMSENQPYIQVPHIQSDHWLIDNQWNSWNYYSYVYASDPQGADDIDSVWAEGPDGIHYRLYDDGTNGDDWPGSDGKYRMDFTCDSPLPIGEYQFYVRDKSGNFSVVSDSLTANLGSPLNLIPAHNSIISDPDFLIDWDKVPGINRYWINVNLTSNWEQYWNISLDSTRTSVTYNEDSTGKDLIEGEVYYLEVHAGDDRNSSHTRVKIAYMIQSNIVIDGLKDPYWDIVSAHIHLGEEELVWGEADDEEDFSADVYMAYDSVYLYGFIEVKDDSIGSKAGWWWDNDAISLKIDTDPGSIIPVPYNSGVEPNSRDIVNIDFTAETGYGDERNGNENTILSRALNDSGYVIEFAVSAAGLINYNADPPENVLLQEGTQVGFYFEVADQDEETEKEAVLGWGHASANMNSGNNVTQFGSMTLLADNQVQLSHDNLVMSADQPFIQVPGIQTNHSMDQDSNEWWDLNLNVYANTQQGLNNIDSVWVEGPDGSHYRLNDNENCGDYGGDGKYTFCQSVNTPPVTGIYRFYTIDRAGNKVSAADTLTGLLDYPENLIPATNTIVSEPDFLIDWDEVSSATGYWININLASDWENYWSMGLAPDQTSVNYNENGQGKELIEGEVYYLEVHAGIGRNSSQARTKFVYAKQGLILIDGLKDSFWETATGHIHLGEDEVVWGNIDDENDCSADVYLAYDSLFLYGYVEVKDEIMGSEYDWWWTNDAFAFRFDIDPSTISTRQDVSDIISLEFTARSDAHDRRDGNNYTMLSRNITGNGYMLEFAVSAKGLINSSPDPDEVLILKEGTQVGFLFQLADEDSVRGREAELAWGHYSANLNSGDNVAQYGSMTLLADNKIQLSRDNLVMGEYQPFIQIADFSSGHETDEYLDEWWNIYFYINVNDPQGLDDIDSVWVEGPDGSRYKLDDNYECGGYPEDGNYRYCNSFDTPFAVGDYHFNVIDKSGNINSITDKLPGILDCPGIILPANHSIISDPDFMIEWDKVPGASYYRIDIASIENKEDYWFWHTDLPDTNQTSFRYDGQELEQGKVYKIQVLASDGRTSSSQRIILAYRTNNRKKVYVNRSNTTGKEDGSPDFPFNTIQEGIDATIRGDTVLVFPGTYIENVNISYKDILLGSLFLLTGDTSFITQTVIDGNRNGSVVSVRDCRDTIIISGFTIINGQSSQGGGIYIKKSIIYLNYLKITGNIANDQGGGILGDRSDCYIKNTLIKNNSSYYDGGIHFNNGELTIINSKIINNHAEEGSSGIVIYNEQSKIYIFNTLIAKNTGTVCISIGCTGSIINSTIADNPDGSFAFNDSYIQIRNCIEWNNIQNSWSNLDSIKYSLIEGGASGTGNIDADPMFTDADAGDYRLKVASPCINLGTPDTSGLNIPSTDLAGSQRIFDGRVDMGAYEFNEELIALIPFTDTAITIDGEITENIWQRSDKYHISKSFTGEVFDGPEDLSAYWKAAWDEDGIYFLVEVTADDTLVTDWTYGEAYEQDRIDIFLDMNTDSLEDGNGPSTGIGSGNPTNGHYQFSFNRGAEFDTLSDWQTGCEIAIIENEENATSVEELFVPWSLITDAEGNEFVPDENISIGFDVYIADNDGPANGEARNRKVWVHDGIYGDAARFNMDYCGKIQIIRQSDEVLNLKVTASSTTICPGEKVQLNVIPDDTTGTYDYTWTSDKPGPAYSFRNPVVSPKVTTTYYINVTDLIYSKVDSVTITVLPLPVVNAGVDTSITYNTALTLNGSVSGGSGFYSYTWSPADSFDYSFIQYPTTHKLQKSNLFTLRAMDYGTGCTNTDQVLVMVTGGTLDAGISVSADTICPGDSVRLLAIPSGGTGDYSYSWTSDPEGFSSSLAGPSDIPSGSMTYFVLISDSITSDFATKKIVVHSVNEPEVSDVSVCFGEPMIPLTAQGTYITWYNNNNLDTIINIGDTLRTGLNSVAEYSFYVTQTDKNCVSPAAKVTHRIIELPEVTVNLSETIIDPGETVQIIAGGADNYVWAPSTGLDRTYGDTVWANPDENTKYTVTGSNDQGCSNIAEVSIYVYCEACGEEEIIFDTAGFIGYCAANSVYPDNNDCSWLIYPSGATSVYLFFDTIDIKPGDYVRLYKGFDKNSELIGEFNNDHKPADQIQSGSMLYIWFHSNESGTGLGFHARYRTNHPVGIEENKFISGLNIYPNPVTGLLNIEFTSQEETEFTISVFNPLLQLLHHKNIQVMAGRNYEVLDMTGLSSGVYYLRISSKSGRIVRKIIVR